ncbi:unnamed protein product [Oppiella nova]|uniref:Uncharacterized protein n=1 Tax=Oppiella nova TaxID=334625 RepID=A0A7R9LLG0_9ACAR|nr:unnamed protein product [Oppiella nova]CAG2164416.1 unnamed protein product [Oppiella nova]
MQRSESCGLVGGHRPPWIREFFAEFFGTFFIVCIGDAAVANYVLNKDNKTGVDHFAVCFAFGVGVLIGISISAKISGAHLNPAVTIALASLRKFPARKIPHYLLAQYFGSFMAAFAVFCAYYEGINAYDTGIRVPYKEFANTTGATGGIFSTYPAAHVSTTGSLVDQILATFLLMFSIMAITDQRGINTPKHLEPTVFALVITGICVAFGLNCGAILNPARDLGPRVFQMLAGYGFNAFKPIQWQYWFTAGILGPHIGAILGAWSYECTINGKSYRSDEDEEDRRMDEEKEYKMSQIYHNNSPAVELPHKCNANPMGQVSPGERRQYSQPLMSNNVTDYIEEEEDLEVGSDDQPNTDIAEYSVNIPRNSVDFGKTKFSIVNTPLNPHRTRIPTSTLTATMGLCHGLGGAKCRLLFMLSLTATFFLIEIIVGYITNSMALVADSFHMLSDVVALVIAYVSVRMSPRKWSKNTFGWARAEVLGALINAVFLCALCFSILVESLKRFYDPEEIHQPLLILCVGVVGFVVNLIGLVLFKGTYGSPPSHVCMCAGVGVSGHGHGHSHGGGGGGGGGGSGSANHNHQHNHHQHVPAHDVDVDDDEEEDDVNDNHIPAREERSSTDSSSTVTPTATVTSAAPVASANGGTVSKGGQMNMHGVFLHVLADALGSVIVIISASIIAFTDWEYSRYVDPALSLCLVCIIFRSTWPLLVESAMILLQTVPTHIQVDSLQKKLLNDIDGVLAVHEFHVWQLAGDRIIASAHIRCRNLIDYMQIAEKVKEFFHNEGIHSTTIQPEFVEPAVDPRRTVGQLVGHDYDTGDDYPGIGGGGGVGGGAEYQRRQYANSNSCYLDCPPETNCAAQTCCGPQQRRTSPETTDPSGGQSVEDGLGGGGGQSSPPLQAVFRRNRKNNSSSAADVAATDPDRESLNQFYSVSVTTPMSAPDGTGADDAHDRGLS